MTACYWVLISDELIREGITWPDGLRFTGPDWLKSYGIRAATGSGASWRLLEDDGAPAGLDGCEVNLVFRIEDGQPVLAERKLAG